MLDNDSAITDHFKGCCICNTESRRCSSSAGAHAVGNAFLVLADDPPGLDVVLVTPIPIVFMLFLLEDFEGDNSNCGLLLDGWLVELIVVVVVVVLELCPGLGIGNWYCCWTP